MRPYLLDINVLIALTWPNHVHYGDSRAWFEKKHGAGFRTCPITQTGFVRISSNPAFTTLAVTPNDAMQLLIRITELPGHEFWPDDFSLLEAFADPNAIVGHRQVTDAYLLRLAAKHDGVLATLDRRVEALARKIPERLEILGNTD